MLAVGAWLFGSKDFQAALESQRSIPSFVVLSVSRV